MGESLRSVYQFWAITLVIKLVVSYLLPLSFDESYYWVWSHHLQLSYFDHPAFVSWLYWLGHPFENMGGAVRWPGVFLGHCTLLIWVQILTPVFNLKKIKQWLWLAFLTPLFGIGSLIITPDIPLMFFWSLALYFLIEGEKKLSYFPFFGLGLSLGLGFLSKYHILIFVPLGFLWLFQKKKLTAKSIGPILLSLLAFVCASFPLLYWNYKNNFISFLFQLNHGLNETSWSPMWPLKFVLDQVLLIFPLVLFWCFSKTQKNYSALLKIFSWGPILFFLIATFRADSEANWTIAAYPSILALALLNSQKTWWVKPTLFIWGSAFLIVFSETFIHWLPIDPNNNKTMEFSRFNPIIDTVKKNTEISPLYASSFQMAAKLSFDTKKQIYKLKGVNRTDFYDFRNESVPTEKQFFLVAEESTPTPKWVTQKGFRLTRTYGTDSKYIIKRFDRE